MSKLHVLIFSQEFPNPVEPARGTFIEQNLPFFPEFIEFKVIAPVPYFLRIRKRMINTALPYFETRTLGTRTIEIFHPRFLLLPRNVLRPFWGWLQYRSALETVLRLNRTWKIDLIHAHFSFPDGMAAKLICNRLNLKYIVTEHRGAIGSFLQNYSLKSRIHQVYKNAGKVIAVSEFTRQQIASSGLVGLPIDVIPNGILMDKFLPARKKESPTKLIYVGNLIHAKGIHLLLEALALLKQESIMFDLTVVGEGKYRQTLHRLASQLGLSQSVRFLGSRLPDEVILLLSEHDVLVQPSFLESFSVVLIEAMAAGLPVLATRCGGPESIVSPQTGVLVQSGSAVEIASGLKAILTNWQAYDPVVIRDYAKARFDVRQLTRQLTCLYFEISGVCAKHGQ